MFSIKPPLLFTDTTTSQIYTLSLHDALPIFSVHALDPPVYQDKGNTVFVDRAEHRVPRSEEHTSELQSHVKLVCRLLLEKKKLEWNPNAPGRAIKGTAVTVSQRRSCVAASLA